MAEMRRNKVSDLEITFVGMSYIISNGVLVVQCACETVAKIQTPDFWWLCMPWKVQEQLEVKAELADQILSIERFSHQLQSAISVASYAVSLEQLENVLNASNQLNCLDLRYIRSPHIIQL